MGLLLLWRVLSSGEWTGQAMNSRALGSFLHDEGMYSAGAYLLAAEEASLLAHLRIALPKAPQAAFLDDHTANFALMLLKKKKKSQRCWWMLTLPLSWQTPSSGICEPVAVSFSINHSKLAEKFRVLASYCNERENILCFPLFSLVFPPQQQPGLIQKYNLLLKNHALIFVL